MSNTAHHDVDQGPGLLSNAIAIIAFIVVIAIVIWGLLHLANISTSWFTNLLPRSTPVLTVSAPASVTSGSPVTVAWKYSGSEKGTYAFLYQCRESVILNDANGNRILCGTTHPITGATSTVMFTPVATASSTIPFSIIFFPAATSSKQISGTATIAISPAEAAIVSSIQPAADNQVSVDQTPVAAAPAKKPAVSYSGPSDLRVRILSVTPGTMSTVQFDVANVGSSPSGSYTFTAYLPTQSGYTYYSPTQASLNPGDHVVNTLQFTQSQGGTVTIMLEPSKSDYSGNNTDSQSIGGGYNASYDYQTYQYTYPSYPTYQYQQPTYSYPSYTYPSYDYGNSYYPQVAIDPYAYYQPQLPDETGYGVYYAY